MIRNEPIASWDEGDSVTGFALVSRKELRQDRNNKDFLDLEREAFLSLLGTRKTQERIQHMLKKGKPLRN